ncbi:MULTISPECIES: hypothetical protein [Amycolatopsis]|uniref:Uncharacterized protein n=2 Tax=Amycolatopsis TaxID=1813 RepID=A0ABW5I648_9PSEU
MTENSAGVPRVVVAGSGSLARGGCFSLALAKIPAVVHILARRPGQAREVADLAAMRARLSGSPVSFEAGALTDLREVLARFQPRVVLNCASHQSPWERMTSPSEWTNLLRRGGFGLTLPLQAGPAISLAQAVAEASPATMLVNGCFPDAVNPLLKALGLPVFCGIGNVMTLAAALRATLPADETRTLRVLAHHVHLHAPEDEAGEALAWLDDEPLTDVTARLAKLRAADRRELNAVTGHAAALLVENLLTGADTRTNVPGPLGLPGGYPVRIRDGALALDLPVAEDVAVRRNQRDGHRDGVVVEGSDVVFGETARQALLPYLPDLAAGFPVHDTASVCDRLLELRDRLRSPAPFPNEEERCPSPARPGT